MGLDKGPCVGTDDGPVLAEVLADNRRLQENLGMTGLCIEYAISIAMVISCMHLTRLPR